MGLLDQIEKLINEHGSATILKERIALANDKYATLEKKVTVLETENTELQKEKERLHLDLRQAEKKIRDLEEQLSDRHSQHLDETAVRILTLIAHHPDCTTKTLANHLELHQEQILYHRDELMQHKYIDSGSDWKDEEYYQLLPKGRKALNDRQLL